jgi:predicted glycoside hydrolase/deacetylase ChbG (UPF0249 family)
MMTNPRTVSGPLLGSSCRSQQRCTAPIWWGFACSALVGLGLALLGGSLAEAETWGERLGWPAAARVIILHADDAGMCYEANRAVEDYLAADQIQSASMMVPCPWFNEMVHWYQEHPDHDLGVHLTLTSEWKRYRWPPVAPAEQVGGLLDPEGYLWRSVPAVAVAASPSEVEREIRAQIEKALQLGPRPGHIDTHMGTLYATAGYARVYLKVAQEYRIPAMVIEQTPEIVKKFLKQGYPMSPGMVEVIGEYRLPKLDDFFAVPKAKTYDEKLEKFFQLVRSMRPGLNEIIFHPSVDSEALRRITNSWQQRIWEARMFADPRVKQFFEREGIEFTNWKEIMRRFDAAEGL